MGVVRLLSPVLPGLRTVRTVFSGNSETSFPPSPFRPESTSLLDVETLTPFYFCLWLFRWSPLLPSLSILYVPHSSSVSFRTKHVHTQCRLFPGASPFPSVSTSGDVPPLLRSLKHFWPTRETFSIKQIKEKKHYYLSIKPFFYRREEWRKKKEKLFCGETKNKEKLKI